MSVRLCNPEVSVVAVGATTLIAAGNYAINDIYVTALGAIPVAAGICQVRADLRCGGVVFHTLNYYTNGAAGTALLQCPICIRSFPDPLVLPSASLIDINVVTSINFSAIFFTINMSGFILP